MIWRTDTLNKKKNNKKIKKSMNTSHRQNTFKYAHICCIKYFYVPHREFSFKYYYIIHTQYRRNKQEREKIMKKLISISLSQYIYAHILWIIAVKYSRTN